MGVIQIETMKQGRSSTLVAILSDFNLYSHSSLLEGYPFDSEQQELATRAVPLELYVTELSTSIAAAFHCFWFQFKCCTYKTHF